MTNNQNRNHQKGISCSACHCAYHDGESYCTASKIHVGPESASQSSDTVCATFKCDPEKK